MVKAAVLKKPMTEIEVDEFSYPEMEDGSVTLRTIYSEICGTDVHLMHGLLADVPYPIIPGHISVGTIEKIAGTVRDMDGRAYQKGEIVTFFDVHETCNECWYCLVAKATTRCPNRKVYGITYSSNSGLLGGWSEVIYLKPGVKIMSLGESIAPEMFIGGGCGLITSFHSVERSGIKLGDTVVIQGTGPVGLCAISWSRLAGANKIIAVGAPKLRLDMALNMGADDVIDIENLSPEERLAIIIDLTSGRGPDVTIECSGNPNAVPEGMQMTRDGGTYLIVGQYTNAGDVSFNPHLDINKKHLTILGCWGFDFSHINKAVNMLKRHKNNFPWEQLISKKYSLENINTALTAVEKHEVIKAVVQPNKK